MGVQTLALSGTYTLLIEGARNATGTTTSYRINVQKVTDDVAALVLGATTNGTLNHVGQQDHYQLTLPAAAQLYFDALTNNGNLVWSLSGPRGAVVIGRSFTASDSVHRAGNPLLDLVAGDYTLTIDGVTDTVSAYAFRLLDVSAATALVPGTAVTGELAPANSTNIYQFPDAATRSPPTVSP